MRVPCTLEVILPISKRSCISYVPFLLCRKNKNCEAVPTWLEIIRASLGCIKRPILSFPFLPFLYLKYVHLLEQKHEKCTNCYCFPIQRSDEPQSCTQEQNLAHNINDENYFFVFTLHLTLRTMMVHSKT